MLVDIGLSTRRMVPFVAWAAEAVQISASNSPNVVTLSLQLLCPSCRSLGSSSSSSSSSSDDERQSTLDTLRSTFFNVLLLLFFDTELLVDGTCKSTVCLFGERDLCVCVGRALFGERYVSLLQAPAELLDGTLRSEVSVDFASASCVRSRF